MIRGAPDLWYERACEEVFKPKLHAGDAHNSRGVWISPFLWREGLSALCLASPGKGMAALNRILHLKNNACTLHAMTIAIPQCFEGADPGVNKQPLLDLLKTGDVPCQRLAAIALGRMMAGREDAETIGALQETCNTKNKAVQAASLNGLGLAARSTCREDLRKLCLRKAREPETTSAAIRAVGMVFLGAGRTDVLGDIRTMAEGLAQRPVLGKKHSKPLSACYHAAGLAFLGTGSLEAAQFLLDALAVPRGILRPCDDRWTAARSLVMVEFPPSKLEQSYVYFV
jgi:hypothetical protein